MAFGSGIVEVERGGLREAAPYPWQTDTAIAKNSWCYTDTLEYKTGRQIICILIETVCRNGNLLLNVGPKGDGSVPQEDERVLKEIGAWLKINGEAVYGTYPWRKYAEGPAKLPEGHFSDNEEIMYTKEDLRFTAKGSSIYVFVMCWPADGAVVIRSMAETTAEQGGQSTTDFHGLIKSVRVLGYERKPVEWHQEMDGLHVGCMLECQLPVVISVEVM